MGYMFTTRHIVGRVWRIVFPEEDSYVINNGDGSRKVVTVLRRVQNGRRYLGIYFWYSHYYLVGRYGIPDFYKLVSFSGLNDVHNENKPAVLVTNARSSTYYIKCVVTPTTTPTTTYTTTPTTPYPTTYTTTPTTTYTTTPTTTPTTTYTTTYEPTVCPYGTPVRVEFENIRDTNKGSNTPYVVQISTSGRRGLPAELKELNFDGDS